VTDWKGQRVLLYITTLFSQTHIDYLHCCWPKLLEESPFLPNLDVVVFSNNLTEINATHLNYTQQLFAKQPSFRFRFATPESLQTLRQWRPNDTNATSRTNFKQWGANMAMMLGFSQGWFSNYDWVIRINPDVLIRSSSFLRSHLGDPQVHAILAMCGSHKVNTDFMALRPAAALQNGGLPFQHMYRYGSHSFLNHEHTAKKNLEGILPKAKFLPNLDPMEGKCRVRGPRAPVYHQHDSCVNGSSVCDALVGWKID